MKVKIKPYVSHMKWSWVITDKIRCLFPFVKDKTYDEFQEKITQSKLCTFIDTMGEKINDYRESKRINVLIHDYDIWSFDDTLAHIILPGLKMLKENKQGAPLVEDKDVPKSLRSTNDPDFNKSNPGETDKYFFKRWDYVLDEMIFAFEHIISYNYDDFDEANQKRKQKGLELFGKYYTSLWD